MESMAFGIVSFGSSTFAYWIESSNWAESRRAAEFPVFVICASHRYVQSYNRTIYIVSHFPIWIIVIIITRSVYLSISPTTGGNAIFQSASEHHHLHVLYATYIFHLGLENGEQWMFGWCVYFFHLFFFNSYCSNANMAINYYHYQCSRQCEPVSLQVLFSCAIFRGA